MAWIGGDQVRRPMNGSSCDQEMAAGRRDSRRHHLAGRGLKRSPKYSVQKEPRAEDGARHLSSKNRFALRLLGRAGAGGRARGGTRRRRSSRFNVRRSRSRVRRLGARSAMTRFHSRRRASRRRRVTVRLTIESASRRWRRIPSSVTAPMATHLGATCDRHSTTARG
jgi:hypothetical protein